MVYVLSSTVKVLCVKNEDTCGVEALAPPILISALNNECE